MKIRKLFILTRIKSKELLGNKGQSLVEFVLLLAAISLLSYGFVFQLNRIISDRWEYFVNLVVNDAPNKPKKLNL